ncbi:MAG: choice-of-anchor J domain-containing protein, partial [Brumimicrobium sp.]
MKKKILSFLSISMMSSGFMVSAQYCEEGPTSTFDSNIEEITANGVSSTSINYTGCPGVAGVEDQTSEIIDLVPGQSYSIDVTFGTCGGNYAGAGEAWIDFDGDEVFDPATESVGTSSGTPGTAPWDAPVTFNFTVPAGAVLGSTRLRVMQQEGGTLPLDPCASFSWGSTIDFGVNIVPEAPPTPDQDPGAPSCDTGSDLTLAGTPPAGIEWYWQGTDPVGTSTADDGTQPYTVFTNATYYARAYDPVADVWSEASSIDITNFTLPSPPPAPVPAEDPSCELTGGTTLTVGSAPTGEEYYWQGTDPTGTSQADPATSPYSVTTGGTYYVASYDVGTQCWSSTESVFVNMADVESNTPNAVEDSIEACVGSPSIIMEVTAGSTVDYTYTIDMFDSFGDGWNGNTVDVFADGNLIGTFGSGFTGGSNDSETFTVPEGVELTTGVAEGGNFSAECSFDILDENLNIVGSGDNISPITPYIVPLDTYEYTWYDAATGGSQLGTGSTLEAVGTSVMPTATAGTYDFYVSQSNGCESTSRTLIRVFVTGVNVTITGVPTTCNGSETGTFEVTDTLCGAAPFSYSVDGGTFGSLPTDLVAGTYSVVVEDDNGDQSVPYDFTVADVDGPSGLVMTNITDQGGQVSWIANGSETEWNVEWGLPGFTPGTGNEIGSSVATDTFEIITGLNSNTEYDVFVSANCGAGSTVGEWDSITFITDCSVFSPINFCESFDSGSQTQNCWTVLDENGDGDEWNMDYTTNPNSGDEVAMMYTDFNSGANDDWLISPQISLSANEVMNFFYRVHSSGEPNDFEVLLSTTGKSPADFQDTLMYLASYNNTDYLDTTLDLTSFSGDVYVAFHVPSGGLDGWRLYIDDVCFDVCIPASGQDGAADFCRADGTADLNSLIVKGQENGSWVYPGNQQLIVDDSLFNISNLPSGEYEVLYIVEGGCTNDTTVATVEVYPPSSAGQNGNIEVCLNEPIDLFSGLSGNVDLGGTWYDSSDDPIVGSQQNASNIPGNYNYDYIVSNGVCPADTSLVEVQVDGDCDYLSLGEEKLTDLSVYPNPATDMINI